MTDVFYQKIVDALEGRTPELRETPRERLGWTGLGIVLDLYQRTSGEDREAMIQAMAQIIEENELSADLIAQLLHLASSLDVAQIEPSVRGLQRTDRAAKEPLLRAAIDNYLAFRKLRRHEMVPI